MDAFEAISELQVLFVDHATLGGEIIQTFMPNFAKRIAGLPGDGSLDTDEEAEDMVATQLQDGYSQNASEAEAGFVVGQALNQIHPEPFENSLQGQDALAEFRMRVAYEYGAMSAHSPDFSSFPHRLKAKH